MVKINIPEKANTISSEDGVIELVTPGIFAAASESLSYDNDSDTFHMKTCRPIRFSLGEKFDPDLPWPMEETDINIHIQQLIREDYIASALGIITEVYARFLYEAHFYGLLLPEKKFGCFEDRITAIVNAIYNKQSGVDDLQYASIVLVLNDFQTYIIRSIKESIKKKEERVSNENS